MRFERVANDSVLMEIEGLRQRLLRDPIGLAFSVDELQQERRTDTYLAAIGETERVIGSLQLRKMESGTDLPCYRIRQVVVDPEYQGRGLGRELMVFAEDYIVRTEERKWRRNGNQSVIRVVLDARVHIVPFYRKLGYEVSGEPFIMVGIEHHPMTRLLAAASQSPQSPNPIPFQ